MNSRLRNFRKGLQLSIPEMSKSIGVSKSTYEKVEYGQRTPSYKFVKLFKIRYPNADTDALFFTNNNTKNV